MKIPEPIIKFNDGNSIALCNRCFCMMCFVSCKNDLEDCVVTEVRALGDMNYISTPIGSSPPPYCDRCSDLLLNYSLNE